MEREIFTLKEYKKLLNIANYKWELGSGVPEENNVNISLPVKEFCNKQIEKYEGNGNRTGCCLNLSMYLLARFKGVLLNALENNYKTGNLDLHCAFIYLNENEELCVCDPAKAKIHNSADNLFFGIPIDKYDAVNLDKQGMPVPLMKKGEIIKWPDNGQYAYQQYFIRLGVNPTTEETSLASSLRLNNIVLKDTLKNLTPEDVLKIKECINSVGVDNGVSSSLKSKKVNN